MHGIEKVTDRIAQDAQAEIEAQLSQAQERADQILAEYETQAREAVERILAHGQREVDAHRAQLHSMARLEARKRVLAAKQDVIEAAFEKALARLCALPREDVYKRQSYITENGLEMGRAQVLQAWAAGREPDVRMNPILLKPSSDVGSQLIVKGEVRGDYHCLLYTSSPKPCKCILSFPQTTGPLQKSQKMRPPFHNPYGLSLIHI